MGDDDLLEVLGAAVEAVRSALGTVTDWRPGTERVGQYRIDLVADDAALGVLTAAGLGVLSEESGLHQPNREVVVVVDPVDGSTNASLGIPWYATSLCAVDEGGPRVALVVNLATGERFEAVRGGGARRDGVTVRPSGCTDLADAVIGLSGAPAGHGGWRQYRALGAVALDLCSVACGRLDAYADLTSPSAHGVWDYLAALLVCEEAGAVVTDAGGQPLVHLDHGARRSPVAAATPALLDGVVRMWGAGGAHP
ncbi:MAG TPA: inositol monophosphatase family protein [Acidimicrobiales bacterium]|nr:inositol monophosphatase family protein [Acidimicrobiales bacterium]